MRWVPTGSGKTLAYSLPLATRVVALDGASFGGRDLAVSIARPRCGH